MKKIFVSTIVVFFLLIPITSAKLTVKYSVNEISRHALMATLVWTLTVQSDKNYEACDMIISFKDKNGKDIYIIEERLRIKIGSHSYSGHEICSLKIWDRVEKQVASLNCLF